MERAQDEKRQYFTPTNAILLNRQFLARSIVTASRPPGGPFVLYDAEKHGPGYWACDLDDWREQLRGGR